MGNQLITFFLNHWPLCTAFIGVLGLVVFNERLIQKEGPKALTPQSVIQAMNHERAIVIDTRAVDLFKKGHITGAKNIPEATYEKLTKYQQKPFILVCARGLQSMQLATKLKKAGFEHIMYLTGGITAWKAASLPLTKGKK